MRLFLNRVLCHLAAESHIASLLDRCETTPTMQRKCKKEENGWFGKREEGRDKRKEERGKREDENMRT
jgi:hypothetical protein